MIKHLGSFISWFQWMFFSSIKEINRLIRKGISIIYLKVTIEKNWCSQNFDFLSLKNLSPSQFLGSFNSRRYHWILKLPVTTEKLEIWEQNCLWLFYYFDTERNCPRVHAFFWRKIKTLIKTKRNWIWKIPHTILERQTLCFSSYKNRELKIKLQWIGARGRKMKTFFVPFIFSEGNFLIFVFLSQRIVYQKTLLYTLFCLFLKSSNASSVSLIWNKKSFLFCLKWSI